MDDDLYAPGGTIYDTAAPAAAADAQAEAAGGVAEAVAAATAAAAASATAAAEAEAQLAGLRTELAAARADAAAARRAADAWESAFRDDPCCAGGPPAPARVADALLSLRGCERAAAESARASSAAATALAARCDAAEAEAAELRAALHAGAVPPPGAAAAAAAAQPPPPGGPAAGHPTPADRLLVDPGCAAELARLTSALAAAQDAVRSRDEDLSAATFSKESKQGRMLMARVRALIRENEELGAQVAEGRLAGLEAAGAAVRGALGRLRDEHAELLRTCERLQAENDRMGVAVWGREGEAGGGGGGDVEAAAAAAAGAGGDGGAGGAAAAAGDDAGGGGGGGGKKRARGEGEGAGAEGDAGGGGGSA